MSHHRVMVLLDPFVGFDLCFVSVSKLTVLIGHCLLERLACVLIVIFRNRPVVIP